MDIDIREEWFGMAMGFFVSFEQRYGPCLASDFFYAQYPVNQFVDFDQILYMH